MGTKARFQGRRKPLVVEMPADLEEDLPDPHSSLDSWVEWIAQEIRGASAAAATAKEDEPESS
jgi:hypothetical protein